jgi:phosphotransferase system enzyme I (PtsI)
MSPSASTSEDPAAERIIPAVAVAPGIAIGPVFQYARETPGVEDRDVNDGTVDKELELLENALARAESELRTVTSMAKEKLGDDSAAIFEAQQMMLRDDELLSKVRERIREHHENAGHALSSVLREHQRRLEASDNAYFRDRASDLVDVQTRVLRALRRRKLADVDPNSIILADTLTAADVLRFSRHGILGCATSHGGATSHVSIIARALEIPALVGLDETEYAVSDGDTVILDGLQGRLVLHPTTETLDAYRAHQQRYQEVVQEQNRAAGLPCETEDGRSITLRANVEFSEELGLLERYGAQGIGLLRTEMLFLMQPGRSLDEEEQVDAYHEAARATGDHGATVRLLDMGGDKLLPMAHREHNPFLGWRGIRVLLDRPELLRPQVRALLRANAHGTFRMLLPMVTSLDEVRAVRRVIDAQAKKLEADGVDYDATLPVGIMVEVPSTAQQAELFAQEVDFFSIGTNDLTQYTLAVDRGNDLVAHYFDALHPAVLSLVERTVKAGNEAGIPTTICGEIAGDVLATPLLLGLGIDTLSASPTYLPSIQRVVRHLTSPDAVALADQALAAPDAKTVRALAREWIAEHLDIDLPQVQGVVPSVPVRHHDDRAGDGTSALLSPPDAPRAHGASASSSRETASDSSASSTPRS